MTTQSSERIPVWTTGDRLRKARSLTGLTTREFADRIGVSQVTVTNAENDRTKVRRITINAWSLATGVPVEWLQMGTAPGPLGPGGDQEYAMRDLNPQPAATKHLALTSRNADVIPLPRVAA